MKMNDDCGNLVKLQHIKMLWLVAVRFALSGTPVTGRGMLSVGIMP